MFVVSRSLAWHGCMQEVCMKATQTNMEESGHDIEQGNSKHEKDSDQPRQNKDLVSKRGASSVTWMWFGYGVCHGPENCTLQITPPRGNFI